MASLHQHPRSPFWQIHSRDPGTGKRVARATSFRWNNRTETRAARELCAKATFDESKAITPKDDHQWISWVRPFLEGRYHGRAKTLKRYLTSWKTVEEFLLERGIRSPAGVIYQTPQDYVEWRRGNRKGGRKAKKNPIAPATISGDIKAFGVVLGEAVNRGWALKNHCAKMGLSRKPIREMRALTLEEEQCVRHALRNGIPERKQIVTQTNQHGRKFTYEKIFPAWPRQEWMEPAFAIAMAQGCRHNETRLRLADISIERRTILFHGKGGKVFTTALNPILIPLIQRLKAAGETMTWDLPAKELSQCGRQWTRFFKRLGLKDFWFHCTRATAITRAHEMNVPYPKAMRFFGHAGGSVHAIYTRLGTEDVSSVAEALASYASTPRNPSTANAAAAPSIEARAPKSSDAGTGSDSPRLSSRSRTSAARSSRRRAVGN